MIVIESKSIDQNTSKLSATLQAYSLLVSTLSTITHYISDGILSIALFSSVVYSTVLHYKSINVNLYDSHINLRRKHLQTSIKIFSTTILAVIRVAFISLSDNSTISLYLAYLSLFIAFTDNLQYMSDAENYKPMSIHEPNHNIARRCVRYAPAG